MCVCVCVCLEGDLTRVNYKENNRLKSRENRIILLTRCGYACSTISLWFYGMNDRVLVHSVRVVGRNRHFDFGNLQTIYIA